MALKAAIDLGILELMGKASEEEGLTQLTSEEVAARLHARNPDAPALLERLLRLLASHSILTCTTTGNNNDNHGNVRWRYGLGNEAKFLFGSENDGSFGPLLQTLQDKVCMEPWYHLKDVVLEGGNPFHRAYGVNFFDYHKDPRFNNLFNKAMHHHSAVIMKKILETYNGFEGLSSLVDVGGGSGANLSLIKAKHPHIRCINFDLPHVIEGAPKFPGIQPVGGDMFASVPTSDAIFMKWILHDWNDGHCLKLLENCWKALPEKGKVIVMEMIVPETIDNCLRTSAVFQLDLLMLTMTHGGKERTEKEFEGLAKAAGFIGIKAIYCACNFWIIGFYKDKSTNNCLQYKLS
ncbi:unnamed protein product [Victoria cruziana]